MKKHFTKLLALALTALCSMGAWAQTTVTFSADDIVAGTAKDGVSVLVGSGQATASKKVAGVSGTPVISLGSSASTVDVCKTATNGYSFGFTVPEGASITSLTVYAVSNNSSAGVAAILFWDEASPLGDDLAGAQELTLVGNGAATLEELKQVISVPDGARTVMIMKRAKVNDATNPTALSTSKNFPNSTTTPNIKEVIITYQMNCKDSEAGFDSNKKTAYVGDNVTLNFSTKNTNTVDYTIRPATGASISGGIFTATAAGTYTVVAKQTADGTYCATEDSIDINISGREAPSEVVISGNTTVEQFAAVTLTVTANNATAYQWKLNDEDIAGATDDKYNFTAETQGTFTYTVTATNDYGSAVSNTFTLTVTKPAFTGEVTGEKKNLVIPAELFTLPTLATEEHSGNVDVLYAKDGNTMIFSAYGVYNSTAQKWHSEVGAGSGEVEWDATGVFKGSTYYFTSSSNKKRRATLAANRNYCYRVTNATKAQILAKTGNANRKVYFEAYEIVSDTLGDIVAQQIAVGSNAVYTLSITLDPATEYLLAVYNGGSSSGNSEYYELALTFPAVEPTDITLDETAITLLGTRATKQLTATIEPDNATEKSVTWKSDDTTVATVDDEGLVSAVGGGTTTITATTANGLTATCSVTVDANVKNNDATLSSLTVSAGTLTPAFDAETEAYTVSLPYGSSIPTVGATKNDDYASDPVITQATAFTAGNNVASVSVTAEDEETTKTYTVTFTMAEPDLRLYEVVLTNNFSAFIDNNYNADDNYSVTGYYFSGEDAPGIKSFTAATNGATATISGDKLIVSIDSYSLEFDLILTAVNPLTEEGEITFDGTEGYVKGGVAGTYYTMRRNYKDSDKSWQEDNRIPGGLNRLYFFIGKGKTINFTQSGTKRNVDVYVNGEEVLNNKSNDALGSITLEKCDNNLVAIVSHQNSGDGAFSALTLTTPSDDAEISNISVGDFTANAPGTDTEHPNDTWWQVSRLWSGYNSETIDVTLADDNAEVTEINTDALNEGFGDISITVTAEDCSEKTHTLRIMTREQATGLTDISADALRIEGNIVRVMNGAEARVYNAAGLMLMTTREDINLNLLPAGIYVIKAEAQMLKVVR